MPSSPYALVGPHLVDRGLAAVPCAPGSKMPGTYGIRQGRPGRGWGTTFDWNRYAERLPTEIETSIWSTWPEAGVGLVLGRASGYLTGVDIDTDDPELQSAILQKLPPSPVQKAGAKGCTLFFRGSETIRAQSWPGALDLLAAGRFVVLAPTIHPSGVPYRWLGPETLLNTSVEELPLLPDDIAARLAAALLPHGHIATTTIVRKGEIGAGAWQDLKDRALANLDAWIPELLPDAGARARATARSRTGAAARAATSALRLPGFAIGWPAV
jgi:Bifunctional DNA primase/polymerase, N-terminal